MSAGGPPFNNGALYKEQPTISSPLDTKSDTFRIFTGRPTATNICPNFGSHMLTRRSLPKETMPIYVMACFDSVLSHIALMLFC